MNVFFACPDNSNSLFCFDITNYDLIFDTDPRFDASYQLKELFKSTNNTVFMMTSGVSQESSSPIRFWNDYYLMFDFMKRQESHELNFFTLIDYF